MRILLLEDELMLQEAIAEYLTEMGYRVDGYEDGQEAYEATQQTPYDLFIFDINTPTIDGLSLLEKLQEDKIHVPTIFISAITQSEQISRAYELGCYDYLKKPFHLKELSLHIDRLLSIAEIHPKTLVRLSKMYTYDLVCRKLMFDHVDQALTRKQSQIIDLFASHADRIVDFDLIRYTVWENTHVDNATIRAEVHRTRTALKEELIESIKGVGYRLKRYT